MSGPFLSERIDFRCSKTTKKLLAALFKQHRDVFDSEGHVLRAAIHRMAEMDLRKSAYSRVMYTRKR